MSETVLDYTAPAAEARLDEVAERLRERNFEVVVVDTPDQARAEALARIPPGAEVHSAKSKTLEDAGIFGALVESGEYDFVRNRLRGMDRQAMREAMRRMGASPEYMLGSVHAVTEAGQLVAASGSGSQIGPYASGAAHVILVVGSQKVVSDLDAALARIRDHVQPYEDARLREQMGVGTMLARVLILEREWAPGRTTIILVREPVGV
jgi:hypothetical protein